ncbi:MAG: DUF814 domain-containing protein [Balneolaceae bacterium]|nr:DUF814 domain-containing protein [Balneolaceae bacterium]
MNYYELIYLKRELKYKLTGRKFEQAITPYKNLLEIFLTGGDKNHRLIFSSAPGNTALFADTYRGAKKGNTIRFFEDVYGLTIQDIEIAETDRWLALVLENDQRIRFRLFSNQANAFLTQKDEIIEVFKEYDSEGERAPESKELDLFEGKISEKNTKNKLTTLNLMLPRKHLSDLIEIHNLEEASDEEIVAFVKKISRQMEEDAVFRLLKNGNTTLFNEEVLPLPTERHFENVNDLISYRYKTYSKNQRLKQKKTKYKKGLERKIGGLETGLRNLANADKGLERAEKYEKWGHLLMAHAHEDTNQRDSITVDDLYEAGKKVEIPLKKKLSIAGNAKRYYEKAKSSEASYKESVNKIPKLEKEKKEMEALYESLMSIESLWDLQDWEKDNKKALEQFQKPKGGDEDSAELPFYTTEVDGYAVWIGKNARSNDKLVQKAHKEDVWMHARGVPGSHLVIRMGNQKEMPPKNVVLEAASYAAYNSKLKGSNLVPVIVTKKKYVRKPKGSNPGAVLVDKEDVEMVTPKKPAK